MIYSGILNKISNLIESNNIFVGKNLFDKDAITEGKTLDENGELSNASGFYCSDFIEVNGGRQIYITKATSTTKVSVYDENKEQLSQHVNEHTFVLERNAAYIRIGSSLTYTPPSTQQIEYGDIATEYEPYQHVGLNDVINKNTDSIVHVEKYLEALGIKKSLSRNIFNPADGDLMTGYYLNASGTPVSLGEGVTTGWVSGYMFVMPKSHYITNLTFGSDTQYMAFYTIDKKLITTKTLRSTVGGFDTPDDCYFVRTTINKNESVGIKSCQIELGIISTPVRSFYENESAEEEAMLNYEGNLIDINNKSAWLQGSFNLSLEFISSSDNYKTTDYIRVKGGQYYLFNCILASATTTKPIIFFNAKKEVVESASVRSYINSNLGFIKIPDSAVYMMVSVDINAKSLIFKNTFYNDIQHKEAKWYYGDVEKETDKYVSQKFINLESASLCAYYDGMFILISSNQKTLYVGRDLNTIFVSRTEINITDLIPDATSDTFVYSTAHIFPNTRQSLSSITMTYVFIVTTSTKVFYYSYAVGNNFSPSFTESNVLIGLTEPIPQMQTDFVKDGKHGLKILPNNDPNGGTRLQYFKALNSKLDIYANGRTFILGSYTGASVSTGTNKPYEGSPTCLYTTTDGIDFTVAYMFGFSGARYRMAGGSIGHYARFKFGEDVDTTDLGAYSGGLSMKVRLNVVPSSSDINPDTKFEYLQEVSVTAATNASKGVFTVSDASDIEVGDCVCITGSATGWEGLVNSTASTTSGGNGVFFMVTSKNGNNVTLATCVGNPHNPLFCTHCHAVNSAWNGVILSTGEEYPDSWLVFVEISFPSFFPNYRINSSEKGMSRSCGVVVRPDNKFIYAADTATGVHENFIGQVTGRTDKLKISPLGIWKFDMADVDDHSKYTLVHGDILSIYCLRRLNGNVLYAAAQGGEALISFDNGDSFEKICNMYDQLSVYLGSEHNKTFIFGGQIAGKKQALIVRLK